MFNKKIKCKCGKKVDKRYNYCPWCSTELKKQIEHKEEFEKELKPMTKNFPFPFNLIFKELIDQLEVGLRDFDSIMENELNENELIKEMEKELEETNLTKTPGKLDNVKLKNEISIPQININIRQLDNGQPVVQIKQIGKGPEKEIDLPDYKNRILTSDEEERYSKLPRKEPSTKVRRFSDRILYELSVPGVKNKKDILINKLQKSIEIKALSKEKVYSKMIPTSLPIKKYDFKEGKIFLELKS